jgi:hypothetical protein
MTGIVVAEEAKQEQVRLWKQLAPGAIFESSFSTLYLVTAKDDKEIRVIPLGQQARASIVAGKPVMERKEIRFGEVTIMSVFPSSQYSSQSSQPSTPQQNIATLDTCFQIAVPDYRIAGEGR